MDTKKCSSCGEAKAAEIFGRKASTKDGLQSRCKPCVNSSAREAYEASPEAQRARAKARAAKVYSTPKEVARQRAKSTKQRISKLQRKASWANEQLIAAYYKEAKRLEELTGIKFHVDHIIPLQGELVSGLHVETNLQLLPAHENQAKHNCFDPVTFCA